MITEYAVDVTSLRHCYGKRRALDHVDLRIHRGEIFALLGPNGGGKTTLFRLVSTLIPIQQGSISVLGYDVLRQVSAVRACIGVVFQAPSLDKKLSVAENIRHQGHLYGLSGKRLAERTDEILSRFGVAQRAADRVETLSGGLRRRVELAKGMLHEPQMLILDEPSTGLDPSARHDLWDYLRQIRARHGVTVVLTTHLLEEAEKAERLGIIDQGRIVALDTPDQLRATVGGDSISIDCDEPAGMAAAINAQFACQARVVEGTVRLQQPDGHQLVPRLVETFSGRIKAIRLGRPTLEDVFIARTGHGFDRSESPAGAAEVPRG